ncbi:ead/Ea22-like family protein [Enterobacter hormaechei]|uniref:ead/Ea22-like family protein n=1 Tax=Enterobacter hormaechei TaxID=158836 RepID=UPI0011DDCA8A|nr:ead/Ea22-like family protein [Enterobacter hormaechei]TXV58531.1 ead/Ea22-like family protein [Enterobacter hormaechei]
MSNVDKFMEKLKSAALKLNCEQWQTRNGFSGVEVIVKGSVEKGHGCVSYQPVASELVDTKTAKAIALFCPANILALLDELEAKEKRIAELEAREVVLPQRYSMLHRVDFDEPYHTEMVYKQHQVLEALHDAGICIKVE